MGGKGNVAEVEDGCHSVPHQALQLGAEADGLHGLGCGLKIALVVDLAHADHLAAVGVAVLRSIALVPPAPTTRGQRLSQAREAHYAHEADLQSHGSKLAVRGAGQELVEDVEVAFPFLPHTSGSKTTGVHGIQHAGRPGPCVLA